MALEFSCPHCSARIRAPENAAGCVARCPDCQGSLTVPGDAVNRPLQTAAPPAAAREPRRLPLLAAGLVLGLCAGVPGGFLAGRLVTAFDNQAALGQDGPAPGPYPESALLLSSLKRSVPNPDGLEVVDWGKKTLLDNGEHFFTLRVRLKNRFGVKGAQDWMAAMKDGKVLYWCYPDLENPAEGTKLIVPPEE